jgi:hypothetical protein
VNRLTVSRIEAVENRLAVSFDCKGQISKFFISNKFIAEYDTSVEDVPEPILIIPFLATIFPITCANQAEVFVETVDATFLSSLNLIKNTLQKFYPEIRFTGNVQAENVVSPCIQTRRRQMLLFSGGIDSLTSFIRHQDEHPILVSIQEKNFSTNTKGKTQDLTRFNISMHISPKNLEVFSTITKSENRIIRSNWIFLLDNFWLKIYQNALSGENWYRKVMHGLAFAGLCAPLAYVENIDKLYIASSFTPNAEIPWGSHPDIDNNIRWTGTKVEHDGYELCRQDKIFIVADYLRDKPGLQICSCTNEKERTVLGKNCSHCEKCCRTILGLELAGVDPNKYGFCVEAGIFSHMKKKIEDRTWPFKDDELYMWKDLQKHASSAEELPHPEARELINWLRNVHIESLKFKPGRSRRVDTLFKILPYPIFKLAERIYIKLNEKLYQT